MKIEFSVDENDLLTHQLYLASTSERIKKQRLKNRVVGPLIYVVIAVTGFVLYQINYAIAFLLLSLLWYLFYPFWERRRYFNHYKRYVADTFKDRFGRLNTVEFTPEYLFATDHSSESKIANSAIEAMDEIPTLFVIRLKDGQSLSIPKDKISNAEGLRTKLQELADALGVTFREELDWRWK